MVRPWSRCADRKDVLDELIQEGQSVLPTQWIETDKREHMRRAGVQHIPEYKSRLVACGQFENRHGIRSDSPTCDVEGLNIVCSYAACNKLRLECSELRNSMRISMVSLWTGYCCWRLPKEDYLEKTMTRHTLPRATSRYTELETLVAVSTRHFCDSQNGTSCWRAR